MKIKAAVLVRTAAFILFHKRCLRLRAAVFF
jgi:hypothetical protein